MSATKCEWRYDNTCPRCGNNDYHYLNYCFDKLPPKITCDKCGATFMCEPECDAVFRTWVKKYSWG